MAVALDARTSNEGLADVLRHVIDTHSTTFSQVASYDGASNMSLADVACHIIDTHFQPSSLQLHGI
jgi:hypothetical protein